MFKVISLNSPESKLPKDVTEVEGARDAREIADHMAYMGGYYVVVEQDGKRLYDLDGRV